MGSMALKCNILVTTMELSAACAAQKVKSSHARWLLRILAPTIITINHFAWNWGKYDQLSHEKVAFGQEYYFSRWFMLVNSMAKQPRQWAGFMPNTASCMKHSVPYSLPMQMLQQKKNVLENLCSREFVEPSEIHNKRRYFEHTSSIRNVAVIIDHNITHQGSEGE